MKHATLALLLWASAAQAQFVASFPGSTPSGTALSAPHPESRGCALGDSQTYGHSQVDSPWPDQLPGYTHYAWVNLGLNGDTTGNMVARYASQVAGEECTVLTLLGGTNDLNQGRPADAICANLTAIGDAALTAHQVLVLMTVPPREGSGGYGDPMQAALEALNACIRAYWAEHPGQVKPVDLYSLLGDPTHPTRLDPSIDWGDHLHPNQLGVDRMRAAIVYALAH